MYIKWLCRYLCRHKNKNSPQYLYDIDYTEIYTLLKSEYPDTPIYIGDRLYKTTTKDELRRYIQIDDTDTYIYRDEYYDCEDFSFRLMGNLSNPEWGALPFGIMWVQRENNSAHAVNIFIDNSRELWTIEPQTDNISKMPVSWHPYIIII